uniref:poly(A)-specific ribonuclease n=1 Tax=Chenopodium quinoa TaxID=63459 RepID=A0A803N0N4_CHEQI
MNFQTLQEIRCESIPISSGSDDPKNALFFHRFPEQGTDSVDHADIHYCSIHSNDVATVQCIECVNYGLPVKHSYHCSNKCFLDAWKNHYLHHYNANVSKSCNEDTKARGTLNRCNSWPPGDMVSWFDEKIEVVIPTGRMWVNKLGPSNALIPSADGIGFSFKLQSEAAVCAEETLVTDTTIQKLNFSSRSLIWLPDSLNTEKHDFTKKVSKVGSFKVLTYNILSDIYVYVDKYPYCPEWALTWEYRRKNLLCELINYNADILCLQEVQSDHFENFFKPELESFGYFVAYKKKTKEVYTGSGYTIDGCATFYRNDIFKEVMSYELEYSKSALSLMEKLELSLRDHARVRLIKDNIALAVILEVVGNSAESAASSRLCVVNTHIYAGKGFPDVKLLQVSDLVNEIEKTIDPKMPLFICGDMNSFPGSDPYILLTKHEVDIACAEAPDPLCIFQHLKLHHSMKLASAYASTFPKPVNDIKRRRMKMKHSKTGEPLFTSLTSFYGSTLDYIFYTVDSLEVEGLLELPDFESVGRALPSPLWSSDHIALMGSFRITRPFLVKLQGAYDGFNSAL